MSSWDGSAPRPTEHGSPWSRRSAATGWWWRATCCCSIPTVATPAGWTPATSTWPGLSGGTTARSWPLGSDVVVPLQSLDRPPELVVVGDGELRTVAATRHAGTDRIRSAIGSRQQLTYPAPDGTSIEAVLTVPRSEPPFPLILHVHGGPIWGYQDFWPSVLMAALANRGDAFLQPNPRGSWGRGRGFASAVVGDMGGADALDLLAGLRH